MEDSNQILKEQIQKLPKTLRDFILGNEWTKILREYLQSLGLEEYQKTLIENEVFLILMGFEEYTNLPKNIIDQAEIDPNLAEQISVYVTKNILEEIAEKVVRETDEPKQKESSGVIDSFEQTIINQAIAMQPARVAGEVNRSQNLESRIQDVDRSLNLESRGGQVPENLPIEEKKEGGEPKNIHDYRAGQDPYREPVE